MITTSPQCLHTDFCCINTCAARIQQVFSQASHGWWWHVRLKHGVFLPLARMPFRPGFPAAAASRLVTGMAQTNVENRGATGGLRSAEEMASEKFGPAWLTEAFHAARAPTWPEWDGKLTCQVMWRSRGVQSLLESVHGLVSEAGTLPADNRVTKVLRTWTGFPVTSRKVQLETARPCLCSGPRTWL